MGRQEGFWWSYDSELLAFTEVDETHIPAYRIVHQGRDTPGHEDHGYPFAGQPNAKVRLGVVPRRGGRVTWMDLQMDGEDPADIYLARVHWMPDGALLAEVENRAQSRLDLLALDPKTGRRSVVLTERSDVWINLHHLFHPLESGAGGGFVLGSERSGFMHLYLYDRRGALVRPLTEGSWQVDALAGVDEANGWVYFTATRDGATQSHLYRVALAGGPIVKLTTSPGMHSIVMDRAHERFIDTVSSIDQPPTITIRRASDGEALGEIPITGDPRIAALQLRPPELVTLATRDGVELHGALYRPRSEPPYPVVVSVYGGPQAQRVQNAWTLTADMSAQYLRELGFAVWKLDNRGSARRGLAFEGAIRHDLGNLEIADQVDGIRWLQDQGFVDGDRVGIYGWSYGGYMAALALARAPGVFKVAVAGAPVSHWDGYDTHYTERYMGTPQGNPEGYRTSSVIAQAENITGKLMLVHGLIDENVHFRHTARLVNALVAAGKDYALLLFPDERHMFRRDADRVYMERRIVDFFRRNL